MTLKENYSRFYKCDLQMQSPLCANWREPETRLLASDPSDRKREIAKEYLRTCYQADLEIIGVTHHNFAPDSNSSFVRWLQEENLGVAKEFGRHPIVIFPGFEIEANVGKGCHVICLFPPEVPLDVIDSRLSQLDLPPDQRFVGGTPKASTKNLSQIIDVVQKGDFALHGGKLLPNRSVFAFYLLCLTVNMRQHFAHKLYFAFADGVRIEGVFSMPRDLSKTL